MAVPNKILKFLETAKVKYESIKHRTVYTAYDKAQTLRVSEKMVGKTLVLKINPPAGGLVIALIPANKNFDKGKFKKIAKAKKVEFASERIIKNKLKGAKVGAIPPFGKIWGLSTFIDKSLLSQPKIIVNSGDYNFSIKISPAVFSAKGGSAEGGKKLIPDLVIGNFSKSRK